MARLADPDPTWLDRVRDEAIWSIAAALTHLAEAAKLAQEPVPVLVLLSMLIFAASGDARPFCFRVQREFPAAFWANYKLANELDKRHEPGAISCYLCPGD